MEKSVAFWDYAMYADLARYWYGLHDVTLWIRGFYESLQQNYNLFYALPSLVSFSLFGDSRLVFILTCAALFVTGAQHALSLILQRLFDWTGRTCFFAAVLGSFILPLFWVPVLQGYPDHAASAFLMAALFWLLDEKKGWRPYLWAGLCLAFAIVLRRHFAYPALALVGARGALDLWELKKNTFSTVALKSFFLSFGALGGGALALLLLIEPAYFNLMLNVDFKALYASYQKTPFEFMLFVLSRLGLGLLSAVLLGHGFLWQERRDKRTALNFLYLFALLWFVLWSFGPAQANDHYLLSALPVFCLVGLIGLWRGIKNLRLRVLVFGLLGLHALYVFWPRDSFPLPSDPPQISLFATPRPPWVRQDRGELERLAHYLASTTKEKDRILVAGSSFVLNQDLLRAIYLDVLKDGATPLRLIPAPEVDFEQPPPLDAFASANIYVVPNTPQYHLNEEGQRVVTALWKVFPVGSKDKEIFRLDRDVEVSVYRREGPWLGHALFAELAKIRAVSDMPRKWVVKKGALRALFLKNGLFVGTLDKQTPEIQLFLDQPLLAGTYELELDVAHQKNCPPPHLTFVLDGLKGKPLFKETGQIQANPGLYFYPFTIPKNDAGGFLSLHVASANAGACRFSISSFNLHVLSP
jgi:hypothetical protein